MSFVSVRLLVTVVLSTGLNAFVLGSTATRCCEDARFQVSTSTRYADSLEVSGCPQDASDLPVPAGCEPFYVFLVARHGSREPTLKRMRQLNALALRLNELARNATGGSRVGPTGRGAEGLLRWMQEYVSPWEEYAAGGQLLPVGAEEHYWMGRRLRARFPRVFEDPYHSKAYPIFSTQVARSAASAVAFGIGLFEGGGPLGPGGHHAFAVISESESIDSRLRFHDLCPRYTAAVEESQPHLDAVWGSVYSTIAGELRAETGVPFTAADVDSLWLLCRQEAGKGVAEGRAKLGPDVTPGLRESAAPLGEGVGERGGLGSARSWEEGEGEELSSLPTPNSRGGCPEAGKAGEREGNGLGQGSWEGVGRGHRGAGTCPPHKDAGVGPSGPFCSCDVFRAPHVAALEWVDDANTFVQKGYGRPVNFLMAVPLLEALAGSVRKAATAQAEEQARAGKAFPHNPADIPRLTGSRAGGSEGGSSGPSIRGKVGGVERAQMHFAHAETVIPLACLLGLFREEPAGEEAAPATPTAAPAAAGTEGWADNGQPDAALVAARSRFSGGEPSPADDPSNGGAGERTPDWELSVELSSALSQAHASLGRLFSSERSKPHACAAPPPPPPRRRRWRGRVVSPYAANIAIVLLDCSAARRDSGGSGSSGWDRGEGSEAGTRAPGWNGAEAAPGVGVREEERDSHDAGVRVLVLHNERAVSLPACGTALCPLSEFLDDLEEHLRHPFETTCRAPQWG